MKKALLTLTIFLPTIAFAQVPFVPLVGIPNVTPGNINEFINALYALSISIAALLAVIKIIIAGVKWMTTDVVTTKGAARNDIQGALFGLLIVLGAVLIITVINPNITSVNLENTINPINNPTLNNSNGEPVLNPAIVTTVPNTYRQVTFRHGNEDQISQVQALKNDCASPKKYIISGDQARCYETGANENFLRERFCTRLTSGFSCSDEENELRARCENPNTIFSGYKGGGRFIVDPENTDYGICIYPRN